MLIFYSGTLSVGLDKSRFMKYLQTIVKKPTKYVINLCCRFSSNFSCRNRVCEYITKFTRRRVTKLKIRARLYWKGTLKACHINFIPGTRPGRDEENKSKSRQKEEEELRKRRGRADGWKEERQVDEKRRGKEDEENRKRIGRE